MSDPYQGIPQNDSPTQWAQPVDPNWAPPTSPLGTVEKKSKRGRNLLLALLAILFVGGGIAGAFVAIGEITKTDPTEVDDWAIRLETSGVLDSTDASGVMMDSSGYFYTAASAVVGATEIRAFLGDGSNSFPAEIVGLSECANVARVEFNGKLSDYKTLDWASTPPAPGTAVLSSGFPTSGGVFTAVEGTVESVDGGEILHSLDIGPGVVGAPLLSADGDVLGVNTGPGRAATSDVVAAVGFGSSDQIGFAATASAYGLQVTGVEPGTPAAELGLRRADIVLSIDGEMLAGDADMQAYCDRVSSVYGSPIALEIQRDGLVLAGEMNGEPLSAPAGGGYEGYETDGRVLVYQTAVDDTGALRFEVPADWEVDGSVTDEEFPDLFAVGDEGYANMFFISTENSIEDEIQSAIDAWECTVLGASETWDDGTYVGLLQAYDCDSDYEAIVVIAQDSYGERVLVDIGTKDTPYADEITKSILDSFASTS